MAKHYLYLQGGLGNQLYILAYANYLKTTKKLTPLRLFGNNVARKDTNNKSKRNVFLRLPEMVGFPLLKTPYVVFSTLMKIDKKPLCRNIIEVHRQDADKWGVFQEAKSEYPKAINIHRGYYQSYKYLDEDFRVKLQKAVRELGDTSYTKNIQPHDVAVHIRRGDFLKPANLQTFHFIELAHYLKGLQLLSEKNPIGKVYLLSDDFEQIKLEIEEIEKRYPVVRIEGNTVLQDLALLTYFRNYVIGNSTFSWWGATLSEFGNSANVVVPREPWVRPMPDASPYPDEWIKI